MKNLVIFTVLALSTNIASAGDFRTLNFGDSCLEVTAREYQLGNSPNTEAKNNSARYEFYGVFLDRAVTISYHCDEDGNFNQGMYAFDLWNDKDLESFFNIARPNLEQVFGPPSFEGSKIDTAQRFDSFTHALRWDKERVTINVNVVGNFDGPDSRKRFQIGFRPAR